MPLDPQTWANVGYCIMNFVDTEAAEAYHCALTGHIWINSPSKKPCRVSPASVQGLPENLAFHAACDASMAASCAILVLDPWGRQLEFREAVRQNCSRNLIRHARQWRNDGTHQWRLQAGAKNFAAATKRKPYMRQDQVGVAGPSVVAFPAMREVNTTPGNAGCDEALLVPGLEVPVGSCDGDDQAGAGSRHVARCDVHGAGLMDSSCSQGYPNIRRSGPVCPWETTKGATCANSDGQHVSAGACCALTYALRDDSPDSSVPWQAPKYTASAMCYDTLDSAMTWQTPTCAHSSWSWQTQ